MNAMIDTVFYTKHRDELDLSPVFLSVENIDAIRNVNWKL